MKVDRSPFGFLNVDRSLLAVGAIAACAALTSVPSLPASAEVIRSDVAVTPVQSFTAPAAPAAALIRDSFASSMFSMVQWPVPATTIMSDDFGFRSCGGCSTNHKGIDLTPGAGFPIQAIANGVVTVARNDSDGLGVHIVIQHVIDGVVYSSLYAHMQNGSLGLAVGAIVTRGQLVGTVGNTGASTGAHLHFGILGPDGIEIDPTAWLVRNVNS